MTDAHLLNTREMAAFANLGYHRIDHAVPRELCEEVKQAFEEKTYHTIGQANEPLAQTWAPDSPIHRMMFLPQIQGLITSLVGPSPNFDHQAVHRKPPQSGTAQHLHQDAEYDIREEAFDIQLSFFIHDTPKKMGGTRFLPGSHFRQVHVTDIGRYQHIDGMFQVECEAGTVVAWHHNLWHGAQPNQTDQMRYMFKVRINPTVRQQRLWNTEDIDDPQVIKNLFRKQRWFGQQERIEIMNRIRFWRFLTNDPTFDHNMWYTRIENEPMSSIERVT